MFGQITGPVRDIVPTAEVSPDLLIDELHAFELGGRRFEIHWTPGGETRSAVIVWLPDEKIAIVGNLFGPLFGNQPNLNTIRGDKPRWALQFIDSIKKLRALRPELVLTGHEEIRGAEHIEREVTRIVDSVQWIHDRTVEGMNAGVDLRTLMREVKPPPELTLTEEYGKVSWNVRAIWHEYTGWFDPDRGTTELYGVPPSSVAPAIAELAGGADRLAERARQFVTDSKPLEALHLLDIALAAAPSPRACAHGEARGARAPARADRRQEPLGAHVDRRGDPRPRGRSQIATTHADLRVLRVRRAVDHIGVATRLCRLEAMLFAEAGAAQVASETARRHAHHGQDEELSVAAVSVESRACGERSERGAQRQCADHRAGKHAEVLESEVLRRQIGDDVDLRANRQSEDRCGDGLAGWVDAVKVEERTRDDRQHEHAGAHDAPGYVIEQQPGAEPAEDGKDSDERGDPRCRQRICAGVFQDRHEVHDDAERGEGEQAGREHQLVEAQASETLRPRSCRSPRSSLRARLKPLTFRSSRALRKNRNKIGNTSAAQIPPIATKAVRQPWARISQVARIGKTVAATEAPESVTANASPRDCSKRLATALVQTVAWSQRFANARKPHRRASWSCRRSRCRTWRRQTSSTTRRSRQSGRGPSRSTSKPIGTLKTAATTPATVIPHGDLRARPAEVALERLDERAERVGMQDRGRIAERRRHGQPPEALPFRLLRSEKCVILHPLRSRRSWFAWVGRQARRTSLQLYGG